MNVSCSSCDTVYRIDPDKVPEAGVRVRCTVCSNVISVSRDEEISVIAAPVDGAVPPAAESEERLSREQMTAAVLGDAFIAPPEQQADTTAPPVPEPTPAPPEPLAVPSPLPTPTPIPVAEAPHAPTGAPEFPATPPVEPVPPPAVPPAPVSEVPESEPPQPEPPPPVQLEPAAQPSPVATAPRPPAVQPSVQKGGLRVARPFSPPTPGPRPTGAPRDPQRPIAPVFRPTPGMPLKPAVALPAEPGPPAASAPPSATPSPPPVEDVPPTPITPQEPPPPPAVPAATPVAQAPPAAQSPAAPPPPALIQPIVNPFMSKDPKQKARRLARALISDMIVYQPEKRQQAIEDGSLKEVFGEEIKKSWEEYVQQVGEEIADSTPFFAEALNDILAGGQSVF